MPLPGGHGGVLKVGVAMVIGVVEEAAVGVRHIVSSRPLKSLVYLA